MESIDAGTPNPDPFRNWREMIASLPQQVDPESEQRPRSALMRYQERRVAHGRVAGSTNNVGVKRRSNKRNRCNKCRLLGRKRKHIKRLVNRLRGKLQRLDVNQSADNAS